MTNETSTSYDPTTWGKSVPYAIRIAGTSFWHRYTFQDDSWTHCGIGLSAHPVTVSVRDTHMEDRCKACWPVTW